MQALERMDPIKLEEVLSLDNQASDIVDIPCGLGVGTSLHAALFHLRPLPSPIPFDLDARAPIHQQAPALHVIRKAAEGRKILTILLKSGAEILGTYGQQKTPRTLLLETLADRPLQDEAQGRVLLEVLEKAERSEAYAAIRTILRKDMSLHIASFC